MALIERLPANARLTHEERFERGRQRRTAIGRAQLGTFKRAADPLAVLTRAAAGRVPQLLAVKYGRMALSPFTFFRGAVSIMAADLSELPHSGLHVQLCGDAHLENMGSFAGPDGRLAFDINDFDETRSGPWEWDVKRMATSILLAGRESGHKRSESEEVVTVFCDSYVETIAELSQMPLLDAARYRVHGASNAGPVAAALAQSERAQPAELLKRYTEKSASGARRFRSERPKFWRESRAPVRKAVLRSLTAYRDTLTPEHRHIFSFYKPVDVGFKVVGTGSVGLRDYVVLMEGNGRKDALFLQLKQQMPSIYDRYLGPSPYTYQGMRVAAGQQRMQPLSDFLLGWTTISSHQYLVRHLNDHKGSIEIGELPGGALAELGGIAGKLLARGHSRSGDAAQLHGYIGAGKRICQAIAHYAEACASQTEKDYELFLQAIQRGKIRAANEV